MDLPGWQNVYDELKDKNFHLISVAEDTGGEAAAGTWFDRAKATFTQIVDEKHVISSLFNMVNVPTGVWIDEEGYIVRPNETAYSSNIETKFGGKTLSANGADYVNGLRDWVAKGKDSIYAMTPEQVKEHIKPRTDDQAQAEALFQLGVYFHAQGNTTKANANWEKAQALRPDSWNYHRQDWSFTPQEAGTNWMKKFQALGDEPYYEPVNLPKAPATP